MGSVTPFIALWYDNFQAICNTISETSQIQSNYFLKNKRLKNMRHSTEMILMRSSARQT